LGIEYRVLSSSDGTALSWCFSAASYSFCDSNVAVPVGATAEQVAALLGASIGSKCPNVTVIAIADRFTIHFPFSLSNPEEWPNLCLGLGGQTPSCCIPNPGNACQFGVVIENHNYDCKCGDADNSGVWTISDAVYLVSYIFGGGPAPAQPCLGDADGNGTVSISDAVRLIHYIFGGGPTPQCP